MATSLFPSATSPSPRLLVVDDDHQIRRLVHELFDETLGAVGEADCAGQALDQLRSQPPDLVLLDLDLPDRDGHTVLDAIRGQPELRLTPVIMITGHDHRDSRLRALRSGVTQFLPKPFDPEELRERVYGLLRIKAVTDSLEDAEDLLGMLARAIDARSHHTLGHSRRVAHYAGILAERLGLDARTVATVRRGALFHDIGKVGIRDAVLLKPGRLEESEYREIQRHPRIGYDLLAPMRSMAGALPIVLHHHERYDGSGYPEGLAAEDIPLVARIVSIADVFDALTTSRPYRPAWGFQDALRILSEETVRGWWDPRIAGPFDELVRSLPSTTTGVASLD